MNKKFNKSKILKYMSEYLIFTLNDVKGEKDLSEFAEGELVAYVECLEILSKWTGFKKYGISDIEKEFSIV